MRPRAFVAPLLFGFALFGCVHQKDSARSASSRTTQEKRTSEVTQTTEITSAVMTPATTDPVSRRVRDVVEGHLADVVDRCGILQVESDRYLTTLHLEIAPSGTVDAVRATGNAPNVDACVAEVARGWKFDVANGRTITNLALEINRPHRGK